MDLGKERLRSGHPGQFACDTGGVEANGSISQHRDEMQEDTAKAEAGKFSNHDPAARGSIDSGAAVWETTVSCLCRARPAPCQAIRTGVSRRCYASRSSEAAVDYRRYVSDKK